MCKRINKLIVLITILSIASCGSPLTSIGEDPGAQYSLPDSFTGRYAIVVTAASDYSSGAHSAVSYEKPRTAINDFLPTISDLAMSSYGSSFYRIERYGANNVAKFNMEAPHEAVWQFSTEGTESNSNPCQMVFLSETKAYLLRYGSPTVWIVNPLASTEAEFKIGEIDLYEYNDSDGNPEVASGLIVGNKLFLVMQRLSPGSGFSMAPVNDAYIAVFNTDTKTEIDIDPGHGGLKGIKLDVRNPFAKIRRYGNYLYVAGADGTLAAPNPIIQGGVQRVNLTTLKADPNIITPTTQITGIEIISETNAYFIQYDDWDNSSLKKFNPQTGYVYPDNVAGIGDSGDRSIQSIIKDDEGMLWISDASFTAPGIHILDTADDTVQEGPISTNLNPIEVVFCER